MKDGTLSLNEDDGLTQWHRMWIKKIFILLKCKGAITAEYYDGLEEDEAVLFDVVVAEMFSKHEDGEIEGL